jgi:hypothetical protein
MLHTLCFSSYGKWITKALSRQADAYLSLANDTDSSVSLTACNIKDLELKCADDEHSTALLSYQEVVFTVQVKHINSLTHISKCLSFAMLCGFARLSICTSTLTLTNGRHTCATKGKQHSDLSLLTIPLLLLAYHEEQQSKGKLVPVLFF